MALCYQCFVLQGPIIHQRVRSSKQTVLFVRRIISVQYLASLTIKIKDNLLLSMDICHQLEVNMLRS